MSSELQIDSFNLLDIITIFIIAFLFAAVIILFKVEKLYDRPKFYLKIVFILVMIVLINDFLIYNFKEIALNLLPISYFIYFLIYPLVYIYSRDLVFHGELEKQISIWKILVFPIVILICLSFIYYPLSVESKSYFLSFHISQTEHDFAPLKIFQLIIIPAYYGQTAVYLYLMYRLVKIIKRNTQTDVDSLLAEKFIIYFIVGVIIFEILIILLAVVFKGSMINRIFEITAVLIFILYGAYISFNQTIIMLQTKMIKSSLTILDTEETSEPDKSVLPEESEELKQLKELIEHFIYQSKIYLDPNLTIENFSKKIHVQSRKISNMINRIYKKNFHHFINEYRIQEALKLMHSNQEIIIEDLYTKVGFNSRSTFNRVFKEIIGNSPSEYLENRKSA